MEYRGLNSEERGSIEGDIKCLAVQLERRFDLDLSEETINAVAALVADCFVKVSVSRGERTKSISMEPVGIGTAVSKKAANLVYNLGGLLASLTPVGTNILSLVAGSEPNLPFLVSSVVLSVLSGVVLLKPFTVKLSERGAAVIWTIWKYKGRNNPVDQESLLRLTNKELRLVKRPEMELSELISLLRDLKRIRTIEEGSKPGEWVLVETVVLKRG